MSKTEVSTGVEVSLENVSLQLQNTQILEQVTFNVKPGSIHCLVGPNGGGKTCTIKCMLGDMPHSDSIKINGASNYTIGYVPQILDFDYTLPVTVDDLLTIMCDSRPAFLGSLKSKRTFDDILDKVGMAHRRRYLMGDLSGGERQRIMLAQSLLPHPDLLILDEPTTGLDKDGAVIFDRLIDELKSSGTTIIWVNHDLKKVKQIADCVTCINRSVLFSGSPHEVLTEERMLDLYSSTTGEGGDTK